MTAYIVASVILTVFVALPLYLKSNMLLVLGMLSFGWVLMQVTTEETLLFARSINPATGSSIDFVTLVLLGSIPAIGAVFFTKRGGKKPERIVLGVLLLPAIFVVGWSIALSASAYGPSMAIADSQVQDLVARNDDYALWSGAIVSVLYLYVSKPKPEKHKK